MRGLARIAVVFACTILAPAAALAQATITDPKTLKYEFRIEDPTTWTSPWAAEVIWPRIEPGIYEFACHEQNYGLINVVRGAQIRAREAGNRPARETPDAER